MVCFRSAATRGVDSLALGDLPKGLAHGIKFTRPVTRTGVAAGDSDVVRFRHEIESVFGKEAKEVAK